MKRQCSSSLLGCVSASGVWQAGAAAAIQQKEQLQAADLATAKDSNYITVYCPMLTASYCIVGNNGIKHHLLGARFELTTPLSMRNLEKRVQPTSHHMH